MRRIHTESRKGNRGHKWFPADRRLGRINFDALSAILTAALLGARAKAR